MNARRARAKAARPRSHIVGSRMLHRPAVRMPRRATFALTAGLMLGVSCQRPDPKPKQGALAEASEAPPREPAPAPSSAVDAGPPPVPARLFAKRFVSKVRLRPDRASFRIGYLRAGAVVLATTAAPVRTDDRRCRGGWFELQTGGFVCNGRDVIAFSGTRLPQVRGAQPTPDGVLPYRYGRNLRSGTPMYRRLPSADEVAIFEPAPVVLPAAAAQRHDAGVRGAVVPAVRQAQDATRPVGVEHDRPSDAASKAPKPEAKPSSAQPGRAVGGLGAPPDPGSRRIEKEPSPVPPAPAPARPSPKGAAALDIVPNGTQGAADAGVPPEDAGTTLASLAGDPDSALLRRLVKGFLVSLDREFTVGSPKRSYWRTIHNGFVPKRAIALVRPSRFRGGEIGQGREIEALPIGYVARRRAPFYRVDARGRARRKGRALRRTRILAPQETDIAGRSYVQDGERLFRRGDVTMVRAHPRPDAVEPDDTWIEVNLNGQYVVAYEGDTPVFVTLASTGKAPRSRRAAAGEDYRTPTGLFRIRAKHLAANMDGDTASDGPYSIDDVPYVMYFQLAYALHGAFWHNAFGRPRSHGCINLSPDDAKWIFNWSDPKVPPGWHGAYPPEGEGGTWVYVHGETPH